MKLKVKMFRSKIDYSINKQKYDSFSTEIESLIPKGSIVLDVGCTTGILARALKKKKCKVVGIDIDSASLKVAAKHCEKVYLIDVDDLKDFDKKLKGQKFDAIALGDILEHLKYPGVLLYHLKNYLTENGVVVAKIPNTAFIWTRLRFLSGNFAYEKGGGLMDEDHLRFFSFGTAKQLFTDSGYKIIKIENSSKAIVNPKYFFVKYLAEIMPRLFSIHIIIEAQKLK